MEIIGKKILVTGSAGFIGAALTKKLIEKEINVIGIDNLNDYYSVDLKKDRLNLIKSIDYNSKFSFYNISISDNIKLKKIFSKYKPNIVINLAAQAGVRYSLLNPSAYIESNLIGFGNVLELCRSFKIENLIFASSSSVYGGNTFLPFSEDQSVNHPVSLYAATKKSNELMAHSYSHLYNLPCTGLRFFTVYGPWGRPDMAPMIFSKSIIENKPIKVFNFGKMSRDFTYIEDVVDAIIKCCYKPATKDLGFNTNNPNPSSSFAPYRIFNVGNNKPTGLMNFIKLLEKKLGKKALINYQPLQDGDVISTYAELANIKNWIDFQPSTSIEDGIEHFCKWYMDYYKNSLKNK